MAMTYQLDWSYSYLYLYFFLFQISFFSPAFSLSLILSHHIHAQTYLVSSNIMSRHTWFACDDRFPRSAYCFKISNCKVCTLHTRKNGHASSSRRSFCFAFNWLRLSVVYRSALIGKTYQNEHKRSMHGIHDAYYTVRARAYAKKEHTQKMARLTDNIGMINGCGPVILLFVSSHFNYHYHHNWNLVRAYAKRSIACSTTGGTVCTMCIWCTSHLQPSRKCEMIEVFNS